MSTTVYAVFREGVYRHECGGIFSSQEAAIDAAKSFAELEPDSWHHFEVMPFDLDARTEMVSSRDGRVNVWQEKKPVFSVQKERLRSL